MRVKKPKRPTTPPSEDEVDDNFVVDPDQIFDELPQPFRLVDKTLRQIFDAAWERIECIEERKALKRSKAVLPLFDLAKQLSEYNGTTCICTAAEGNYLFISNTNRFLVVDSLLDTVVASYEELEDNTVQMSACCLQEGCFLISTLDDVGCAKLFCFTGDKVHLIKTFSEPEGISKQAMVTLVDISQDGGYIGVGWKVPMKESWVEIYKIPRETWIKELETAMAAAVRSRKPTLAESSAPDLEEIAAAEQLLKSTEDQEPPEGTSPSGSRPSSAQAGQHQPGLSVISFTKPAAVLRVRPPAPVGPCAATNCSAALKATDAEGNVIGTGSSHVLMTQFFENYDKAFQQLHKEELKYLNIDDQDLTSFPRLHFLAPSRLIPSGLESAPSKVNSLAVWWSGGTQLYMYSLVKNAKDLEHKPDIVWPHSEKIITSAVSECGCFMALGLNTGTVVVWDVYRGTLLKVCPITEKGRILVLCFLTSNEGHITTQGNDLSPSSASSCANLIVSCDDGTFCLLQCGVALSHSAKPLEDRSAVDKEVITNVVNMSQTPQVVAAVVMSGRITMYDVCSCTAICHVGLPESYLLSPQLPCICANGKVLILIGAQSNGENQEALDRETTVPFSYNLQLFPTLKKYWREDVTSEVSPPKQTDTIEARLHSLIQGRLVSQEDRQMRLQQRWAQYQTELKNIHNNKTRRNYSTWLTAKSVSVT